MSDVRPHMTSARVKHLDGAVYARWSDGSLRRWPPRLKGKAAKKADKRKRHHI
jgi:hypothetical protein